SPAEDQRRSTRQGGRRQTSWSVWAWVAGGALVVIGVFVPDFWRTEEALATTRPPVLNKATAPGPAPVGMTWDPARSFWMGDGDFPDAQPEHLVYVDGFWMDKTEVTNEQFARFVAATAYRTIAERPPDPKEFPNVPPEDLKAGSIVFTPPESEVPLDNHL